MEYPNEKSRTFKVWEYIKKYMLANNGRPPSIRDFIRDEVDKITSTSVVSHQLERLEKGGLISRPIDGSDSKSIQITDSVFVLPRHIEFNRTVKDYSILEFFFDREDFFTWLKEFETLDVDRNETAIISSDRDVKLIATGLGLAVFDPEVLD